MSTNIYEWLDQFNKKNKRKLKTLHIGNIANNAYLNAKLLTEKGIDCDVLSYDYYHIMGCPEWEECSVDMSQLDQFSPDWYKLNIKDFKRPNWFVQGNLYTCLKYLIHKNKKNYLRSFYFWFALSYQNKTNPFYINIKLLVTIRNNILRAIFIFKASLKYIIKLCYLVIRKVAPVFIKKLYQRQKKESKPEVLPSFDHIDVPDNELLQYLKYKYLWDELFKYYDVLQFYATTGVYGLISNKKYIAYEHGTIRSIPFETNHQGILTKAIFQNAEITMITNCDNIVAAKKLNLKKYYFVPHVVNSNSNIDNNSHIDLKKMYSTEYLIFHPSRQDWSEKRDVNCEKGNDIFIHGFKDFVYSRTISVKCIMIDWGVSVSKSKELIQSLDIEKYVIWLKPLTHSQMINYVKQSDAVFDQATIGTFGAIPPKCMSLGKPVFVHVEEKFHSWCFKEMPPVFKCKNKENVFEELSLLLSGNFDFKKYTNKAQSWYKENYSNDTIINAHLVAYRDILSKEKNLNGIIQ